MKTNNNNELNILAEKNLFYRINGTLAILTGLLFFTGTMLDFYNLSTENLFSEGNILTILLVLFVSGIFISWYNEMASGLILLFLGTGAFVYLLFHPEHWLIYLPAFLFFVATGAYLVLHNFYLRRKIKNSHLNS